MLPGLEIIAIAVRPARLRRFPCFMDEGSFAWLSLHDHRAAGYTSVDVARKSVCKHSKQPMETGRRLGRLLYTYRTTIQFCRVIVYITAFAKPADGSVIVTIGRAAAITGHRGVWISSCVHTRTRSAANDIHTRMTTGATFLSIRLVHQSKIE